PSAVQEEAVSSSPVSSAPIPSTPPVSPAVQMASPEIPAEGIVPPVVAPPVKDQRAESSVPPVKGESSIRVDVVLLDKLMNLVGELVLARNQLLQRMRERQDAADMGTMQRMNLITTELQDTVMKTRMQPIRNVWEKLPRVVRDLARANGKEIDLVMVGAETELDKTLLEAIKDPLTHIVRNAADHGIETPETRKKRGKTPKGTLRLKACHEGGQIGIEISDDGGGIDVEKVKRKAIEKGLLSAETAARLSEREGLNLIFLAGLSTAEKVTNVSGRGVGMDVVKTNIEKIGGIVEIATRLGEGTDFRIKIPLTLAIIPALMVTSGGERFAIPQTNLLEMVCVDGETGGKIEVIRGAEFYRLRGALLPLLFLNRVLGLPLAPPLNETNIVVLRVEGCTFGLVVDAVNDNEEIVVKPLGRHIKSIPVLAGATILGDGKVALILDIAGIAGAGGLFQTEGEGETLEDTGKDVSKESGGTYQSMLLFSVSERDRFSIPLARVARLEEFTPDQVERAAGREVIQYREGLLPLVRLDSLLGIEASQSIGSKFSVIVLAGGRKHVGLAVGRILDIIETEAVLHSSPVGRMGVRGSLIIGGQTVDLLDIDPLIENVEPGWMAEESAVITHGVEGVGALG
ncbi:MAG: chemotaxis protein CheA, partial [Candidatus Manganitrophaceae bacterium]